MYPNTPQPGASGFQELDTSLDDGYLARQRNTYLDKLGLLEIPVRETTKLPHDPHSMDIDRRMVDRAFRVLSRTYQEALTASAEHPHIQASIRQIQADLQEAYTWITTNVLVHPAC